MLLVGYKGRGHILGMWGRAWHRSSAQYMTLEQGNVEAEGSLEADFLRAAGSSPVLEIKKGWKSGKRRIPGI